MQQKDIPGNDNKDMTSHVDDALAMFRPLL